MQNGFGLKDLILIALVVGAIASIWLAMVQEDRRWEEVQTAAAKIGEIEKQIARLERSLDERPVVAAPAADAQAGAPRQADAHPWARPGVPVTVSEPWDFTTDPYDDPAMSMGGEFTEFFEGQPPKVTPYTYADVYGRRVVDMVCESLGWYDPVTLEMRGRLAGAWQYDPGGEWLRVKIREGAQFSNGQPVLAEDVRWTFEDLLFNPQIEAERFRSVYNAMADVAVIGDASTSRVVEFTFKQPRFDNLDQAFGFKVLPKSVYSEWIESPSAFNQSTSLTVGSGPFKFERVGPDSQWSPPADIVLVRNEQYWGPRPPLDSYRYKVVQDGLSRLVAYTNGQGDMMRPSSSQFVERRADPAFTEEHDARKWFNMRGGYSFIAWQCGPRNGQRLTPFHDKRVRQAMTMLIDRERIRRDIGNNLARPATGPFLSSTPQANPEIEPWPHDPERALALLADAGWEDTDGDGVLNNERGDQLSWEITFGNGSESTLQMVTAIQKDMAGHGIRVELNPIDWSVLTDILNRRDFDAITFAWSASAPENDPNQIWHSDSIDNQGDNFVQWASEEADRLIEKGRATLDFRERMAVWHELHEVFHEEQPYTFMSELPWLRFTTKRSGNIQEYSSGLEPYEFWVRDGAQPMPN